MKQSNILFRGIIVLVILVLAYRLFFAEVGPGTSTGEIAPVFQLPLVDGNTVDLADYRGYVVLMTFWTTWCGVCRETMPSIAAFQKMFIGKPFMIIAVNVEESPSTVASYLKKNGYQFPVALDQNATIAHMYQIPGFPTTFLIDRDGKVAEATVGNEIAVNPDKYVRKIETLLEQ